MDFDRCSEKNKNRVITASENNMKFIIKNPNGKQVSKVTVDGCLINDHRERCDYLFEIDNPRTDVYYLELKGSNIDKAYSQLKQTLGYCRNEHVRTKKLCHIVASRVPRSGSKNQVLKKRFQKETGSKLYIGTRTVTVSI